MADYYGNSAATTTAQPPATGAFKKPIAPGSSVPGSSLAHSDHAKIFVGGLSWQTTEESLQWHFEQYGPVVSVEVMRDRVTGDPRGFAFVVFADPATVDLVMVDKDKHEVNHKLVDVKRAQARGVAPPSIHGQSIIPPQANTEPTPVTSNVIKSINIPENEPSPEQLGSKVFVGGLPPHVDRDELQRIFGQFGTVVDAIVMLDQQTQRSRGFGFVTFGGADGAAAAQRCLDVQPVDIHGRKVEVKLATPRAEQPQFHSNNTNTVSNKPRSHLLPPGPKHVGLRAGLVSAAAATGEFAGLAVAYGRNGWKAGYGTKAFGKAGWDVWEDTLRAPPERAGFSFSMLMDNDEKKEQIKLEPGEPPVKRPRLSS